MWIHPDHPNRDALLKQAQKWEVATGENLATIPRGQVRQLKITLDEYDGKPYISICAWESCPDGSWQPTKGKLVTIRRGELDAAIEALIDGRHRIEGAPCEKSAPPPVQSDATTPQSPPPNRREQRQQAREMAGNLPTFEAKRGRS